MEFNNKLIYHVQLLVLAPAPVAGHDHISLPVACPIYGVLFVLDAYTMIRPTRLSVLSQQRRMTTIEHNCVFSVSSVRQLVNIVRASQARFHGVMHAPPLF